MIRSDVSLNSHGILRSPPGVDTHDAMCFGLRSWLLNEFHTTAYGAPRSVPTFAVIGAYRRLPFLWCDTRSKLRMAGGTAEFTKRKSDGL